MPTSNDPKAKPDVDPADQEAQQAAALKEPPEPDADDPVTTPQDDSWRRPEPAEEPKGYADAVQKEHDEAQKTNAEAGQAAQEASVGKK